MHRLWFSCPNLVSDNNLNEAGLFSILTIRFSALVRSTVCASFLQPSTGSFISCLCGQPWFDLHPYQPESPRPPVLAKMFCVTCATHRSPVINLLVHGFNVCVQYLRWSSYKQWQPSASTKRRLGSLRFVSSMIGTITRFLPWDRKEYFTSIESRAVFRESRLDCIILWYKILSYFMVPCHKDSEQSTNSLLQYLVASQSGA